MPNYKSSMLIRFLCERYKLSTTTYIPGEGFTEVLPSHAFASTSVFFKYSTDLTVPLIL